MQTLGILLFPYFETLDVFGPLEMFGQLSEQIKIVLISETGGIVQTAQGQSVVSDFSFKETPRLDLILIPGGRGTRKEVDNPILLNWIQTQARIVELVLSVCTGSALLAKAQILDGLEATTNKLAFDWVVAQGPNVKWKDNARWVDAGKVITSSGVSAGIDMSLYVISRLFGDEIRNEVAKVTEYVPNINALNDPFSRGAQC